MTTSSTSIFNPSAQDIIDLALTDIGALGPQDTPNPDLRPHALIVLQLLLKRMDTEGLFTWKVVRRTQALISGTTSYILGSDVSDVDEPARYTQLGATVGTQVSAMARDEYMRLPDRTIQGVSYQYYAEKSLNTSGIEIITLFLFPVPPNTGDSLEYAAGLRILDLTNITQTLDVPQKWINAIRWGLVAELAYAYGLPADRITQCNAKYQAELTKAIGDDNERGGVQFVPWGDSVSYGYGPWGGGYR